MSKPGLGSRHQTIAAIIRKRATDGEPCHVCTRPIDTRPEAEGGPPARSRWAFSADHIRPRKRGGPTTLANYLPAHYGCNSRRGDGSNAKKKTWRPRRW